MLDSDTLEFLQLAATAATAKKAFEITVFDVSELTSFTDAFLLCSTSSGRHLEAVATEVQRRLRDSKRKPLHAEGTSGTTWVLVDYGDFIIHIFTEEKRSFYNLDALWGDAPQMTQEDLGIDESTEEPATPS